MTNDDKPESVPEFDPTSWLARYREFEELCESVRSENKVALFGALAQVGITSVLVEFDGYGDSGQLLNKVQKEREDHELQRDAREAEQRCRF